MKIVLAQEHPPAFEVQDYDGPKDFNDVLAWLHRKDLPEDLSLSFEGGMFRFRSRVERVQFALGFDKAFDLLYDEPDLPLWTDFDGVAYLRLGDTDNKEGLNSLKTILLQELYLSKWPEHDDEFMVYASATYSLNIKRDIWNTFSIRQKQSIVDRCQGFCEALDT